MASRSITYKVGGPPVELLGVCPGMLVSARLFNKSGTATLIADADGLLPYMQYRPIFGGWTPKKGQIGGNRGNVARDTDPIQIRTDIGKLWCPFGGDVFIAGGAITGVGSLSYDVEFSYSQTRGTRSPHPHSLTALQCGLDNVGAPLDVPVPPFCTHVWTSEAVAVHLKTADGFSAPATLNPGTLYPLGVTTAIGVDAGPKNLFFEILF